MSLPRMEAQGFLGALKRRVVDRLDDGATWKATDFSGLFLAGWWTRCEWRVERESSCGGGAVGGGSWGRWWQCLIMVWTLLLFVLAEGV
jgi:hypothetical protein